MTTATSRSHALADTLWGVQAREYMAVVEAVRARTRALGGWRAESDATYRELGTENTDTSEDT